MSPQRLIICSGPIAVGKSSVIGHLTEKHDFRMIRSGAYLTEVAAQRGIDPTRLRLVELGDQLDLETDYRWVVDHVAIPSMNEAPAQRYWIFDSARKRKQVRHFKEALPDSVCHIHFTAPDEILTSRYESRNRKGDNLTEYQRAIDTDNEREARSLVEIADCVIDTSEHSAVYVAGRALEEFTRWSK